ncbi:Rne/Rng family ribonuclease [Rhizosaccharibacter radicis]|uniref:Ribonuclease E n=1 Tax=Rhizosaccharibacter radicis TaxID=2782605 RepID=A0ABT1VUU8_9PROT|nr:Rne/Rng family ribonuclease [Acetobacteraceae bacterium KSS12]
MTKRMLIDTTHAEETRVVVLDGNQLEDYDVETAGKKQLKGNIYLAKVVRIEPSLQAAFIEYGGNRHGFLAFSEIHPDYYQIPVADRERLLALQEEEARAEEQADDDAETGASGSPDADPRGRSGGGDEDDGGDARDHEDHPDAVALDAGIDGARVQGAYELPDHEPEEVSSEAIGADAAGDAAGSDEDAAAHPAPETVSGESDNGDEGRSQRRTARFLRQYKIQEVIRRRQILLVQVVKEERGNKGAALTTYISLAGRFSVLMPNSPRGGGVSRKITSAADRRRLKEITAELGIPRGMAMIVRTAGAQRPQNEIRRDGEYLLRLWDDIRENTLNSMAPALVYEEASLIKRAIRDLYTRDIEEISVDGEAGWRSAREFMRMLMPANANKVKLWRDGGQPLFSHHQVERHLDAMLQPTVQLRSGGYLVINQTEALVAIDVNSGRSTRERGIEETALRTNLEAADEVARQLRLRDLAGLIVIDFIDMEARRHNAMVERRLKDALRNDRARIQVGSISHFGLMEMSRQRLRPSLAESSFVPCPHCGGTGFMRSTDSAALHVLRAIEEEGAKSRAAEILVKVATPVALYVLNHKRSWLAEIESRHRMTVQIAADDTLIPPNLHIERVRPQTAPIAAPVAASEPVVAQPTGQNTRQHAGQPVSGGTRDNVSRIPIGDAPPDAASADEDDEAEEGGVPGVSGEGGAEDGERRRKRRRRRRRGGRRPDENETSGVSDDGQPEDEEAADNIAADAGDDRQEPRAEAAGFGAQPEIGSQPDVEDGAGNGESGRRRGRRGGRNRRRDDRDPSGDTAPAAVSGPTPANPFAGSFDIFEMIEREAEAASGRSGEGGSDAAPGSLVVDPSASAASFDAVPGETARDRIVRDGAAPQDPYAIDGPSVDAPMTPEHAEAAARDAQARDGAAADAAPVPEAEAKTRPSRARKPRVRKAATEDTAPPDADAAPAVDPATTTAAAEPPAPRPRRSRARKTADASIEAAPATVPAETPTAPAAPETGPEATPSAAVDVPATPGGTNTERAADPSIVQPTLITEDTAPAARRGGWWRR